MDYKKAESEGLAATMLLQKVESGDPAPFSFLIYVERPTSRFPCHPPDSGSKLGGYLWPAEFL
jgi:hypothetical protein